MSIPVPDALLAMSALTAVAAGYVILANVSRGVCNRVRRVSETKETSGNRTR